MPPLLREYLLSLLDGILGLLTLALIAVVVVLSFGGILCCAAIADNLIHGTSINFLLDNPAFPILCIGTLFLVALPFMGYKIREGR